MTPELRFHIEELVLDGFPPGDRDRIGEAVERELARLVRERGQPPWLNRSDDLEHLDGGWFAMELDRAAEAVGVRIAESIYGGQIR